MSAMANSALLNTIQGKGIRIDSKSAPQLPPINGSTKLQNDNNDLNKVVVITKNDLDRITGHLNRRQKEKENVMDELNRRKELHEKSLALTKSWNNTIEGARRKKLEQKKIREDKEEDQKRKVDVEHEKFMAEERRKQLDQAKLLQYYETDKIKTFHSALRLTEVLKERDAQLEMKKLLEKVNQDQEHEERIQNEANLQLQLKEEEELVMKKRIEQAKLTEYHKAQIKKRMDEMGKERDEKDKEGEELRKLTEQFYFEQDQLHDINRKKQHELKQLYDKTIDNRNKMSEAEKIMDEEENEEIRMYAAAKQKMAKIRWNKERELWKEKQEQREKMIAYLGSLLKQQEADEDTRIAKALAQREAKLAQEEREKYEKAVKMNSEIYKHRVDTIRTKQMKKEIQEREDEDMMKQKMEADHMYHVFEEEKLRQRQKKLDGMAKTNLRQAKDRREIEKNTRITEKDFIKQEAKLMELEDKQFEDYANRVIDYLGGHGRNIYPLKKVLNKHLLETQIVEDTSAASQIKKHQNEIPTGKNLGFMPVNANKTPKNDD